MEPTDSQRRDLAKRVRTARVRRYSTQKAAYIAAGVNSATWSKAEAGESISERSLIAIVRLLWPETGGDWEALVPPLQGSVVDELSDAELDAMRRIIGEADVDEVLRRRLLDDVERRERGVS